MISIPYRRVLSAGPLSIEKGCARNVVPESLWLNSPLLAGAVVISENIAQRVEDTTL
jgi:hypothetical protein